MQSDNYVIVCSRYINFCVKRLKDVECEHIRVSMITAPAIGTHYIKHR